jgi:hypothetical protein
MPKSKHRPGRKPRRTRTLPEPLRVKAEQDYQSAYIKTAGRQNNVGRTTSKKTARHIGIITGDQPTARALRRMARRSGTKPETANAGETP